MPSLFRHDIYMYDPRCENELQIVLAYKQTCFNKIKPSEQYPVSSEPLVS